MRPERPWKCPGCQTYYAPFIDRCQCERPKEATGQQNVPERPPERTVCTYCGAVDTHTSGDCPYAKQSYLVQGDGGLRSR